MKKKIYFSKKINQHFRFIEGGIIFEDKVTYTTEEIDLIKKSGLEPKFIHEIKLQFDATILSEEQLKKLTENYSKGPSNFEKAVNMASDLMQKGTDGKRSIFQASEHYFIAASAIGAELGKRRRK